MVRAMLIERPRRSRGKAGALFCAATFAFAVASTLACQKPPTVNVDVYVPGGVGQNVTWVEVGVFPGGCPPLEELVAGVPAAGFVTRIAFRTDDANPPAIGDLQKAPYGFAAAARGTDCSVLAVGCSSADVTDTRTIAIQLD